MSIPSIGVIFFINWLIIFFIMLPLGIKVPEKQKLGHANSAPEKTYIIFKLIASFFVSILTTTFVIYFIKYNYF